MTEEERAWAEEDQRILSLPQEIVEAAVYPAGPELHDSYFEKLEKDLPF